MVSSYIHPHPAPGQYILPDRAYIREELCPEVWVSNKLSAAIWYDMAYPVREELPRCQGLL